MSERRRILHIAWTFGGSQEGISRAVTELARLQAPTAEVTVLCARSGAPPRGVRVEIVRIGPVLRRFPFALAFALASRAAAMRLGPFDLIHAHVPTLAPTDVMTVHLFPPRRLVRLTRDTLRRAGHPVPPVVARRFRSVALLDRTYRLGLGRAGRVVAVSGRLTDTLVQDFGLDRSRLAVVPPGIIRPPSQVPVVPRPRGAPRVMLFVGHQFVTKGLGSLIDAMARLGDASPHLVVVGEGSEGSYDAMRAHAARRGVAAKIRFDGLQASIWGHLRMADAMIYPSFFDTFGLAVGEALADGCPVIATRAAGIADVLPASPALRLVERAEDVDSLCAAIRDMPVRRDVEDAARAAVAPLTWEAHARATEAVYAALPGSAAGRTRWPVRWPAIPATNRSTRAGGGSWP